LLKPKRKKCPVCRGRNSFVFENGYCEEINGRWVTVRRSSGHCKKCGFYYKESEISLEEQAKKYKIEFIKKLALKVKKHKNKKETKSLLNTTLSTNPEVSS